MENNELLLAGGLVATSKGPPLHLIPTIGLERLAERFQCGIDRKGDKAWNALSNNQQCLTDRELLLNRIGHLIHHALKLRDKVVAEMTEDVNAIAREDDDDAGAIAWGGIYAICAIHAIKEELNVKESP